jgi:hypothetical protein
LIKGIIAQVGLSIPAGAIQFSSIEFFKEFMSKQNVIKFSPDVKNFLAGVGGTFMAMCLRVPQEASVYLRECVFITSSVLLGSETRMPD